MLPQFDAHTKAAAENTKRTTVEFEITAIDLSDSICFGCCCTDKHDYNPGRTFELDNDSLHTLIDHYQSISNMVHDKKIITFNISIKSNKDNHKITSMDMFAKYLCDKFGADALNKKPEQSYQMER